MMKSTAFLLLLSVYCVIAPQLEARYINDRPYVDLATIEAYLAKYEAQWQKRMPAQGTRLFYLEEQWPSVIATLGGEEGLRPEYRQDVMKIADRLAASPTRTYVTPEEVSANNGQELYKTEGESWMRRVGDDIFLLCLAAKISNNPAYEKQLRDTVIAGCMYPQWGRRKPNKDLACGHMGRAVALAWDWHRDLFNEQEQVLVRDTMRERMNDLFDGLKGGNFWARAYTENHNHVNAAALGMAGLAFYGDIPEAREWLAGACANFDYVAQYSANDGSSDEGVPYWTYSLSFILQYIEATKHVTGADRYYELPFLQNAASYRVGCSTPGLEGTLPWGDAPLRDYYGPQHLLARLAAQYNDSSAQYVMEHIPYKPRGGNDVEALLLMWYDPEILPVAPTFLDYHAVDADLTTTRSGWGNGDYLLTIKSGYTNRNHSHLDAGALAFVFGDTWLLLAPGYGLGSGQAIFWHRKGPRWDFFSNATESHSTLLINGQNQLFDNDARATIDGFISTPAVQWTSIDLSRAYRGETYVRRSVLHVRNDYILTLDRVVAQESVEVEWLAQVPSIANVEGSRIAMTARAGSLEISLLEPLGNEFAPREATSPHFDKPNPRQETYAASVNGEQVDIAVLLTPRFRNRAKNELVADAIPMPGGGWTASVNTEAWSDYLVVNSQPDTVAWPEIDGISMPVLEAQVGIGRREQGILTRLFAVGAFHLESQPLGMTAEAPTSFCLQRHDAAWLLVIAEAFTGKLQLGEGLQLYDEMLEQIYGDERIGLAPGTYLLSPDFKSAQAVLNWSKSLYPMHEMPSLPIAKMQPVPPAPAEIVYTWEAEQDYTAENSAVVVSPKSGASKALALKGFGNTGSNESLQWKVNVKRAGSYHLKLRYCIANDEATVAVLVDGAAPSQAALLAHLKPTGGWSNESDDWQEVILCGPDGKPITIPLSMGSHVIELTDPSGPVNLDTLSLAGY